MMTRAFFFKSIAAVLGIAQWGPAQSAPAFIPKDAESKCLGVIDGEAVEIDCPEDNELCPLKHLQVPKKIYPVEYDAKIKEQYVAVDPLLHACAQCGIVYSPKAIERVEPLK